MVLDNARIHRWQPFRQIADYLGIRIIYLSPYSPDYNAPIEEFWRDLKHNLRRWNELYQDNPRTMIYIQVYLMRHYNIAPILSRVGYQGWCRQRQ